MANPRKSLLSKTFGHLKVVGYAGQTKPGGNSLWNCTCQCGTQVTVAYQHLTSKKSSTKSCGCMLGRWPRKPRKKKTP